MARVVVGVERHALSVSANALATAAQAIETALNVNDAKAAAKVGNRKHALSLLHGANVLRGTIEGKRGSVIQKRKISLCAGARVSRAEAKKKRYAVKPKRRSGASNWPRTRVERLAMENRKHELERLRREELQRLAQVEATADALDLDGLFDDAYLPTEEEARALSAMRHAVAMKMGVAPEELAAPTACCTCVRDNGRRLAAYEKGSAGRGAHVAVKDGTACVQFSLGEKQRPLGAGEALLFPLALPQCPPAKMWVVTLQFQTRARGDAAPDAGTRPRSTLREVLATNQ